MTAEFFIGLAAVCALGLIAGSFSTALIWRIPRGVPWVFASKENAGQDLFAYSACPSCHTKLKILDLIPVFSWLFLRGRCRHCSQKIGAVYPLSELFCLIAFGAIYLLFGFNAASALIMLAVPFLVALAVIDTQHMILPDQLHIILSVIGSFFVLNHAYSGFSFHETLDFFVRLLAGAVLYFVFAYVLRRLGGFFLRREAMGFGDVKLFAVCGLWLGVAAFPYFLISCGLAGLFFGVLYKLLMKNQAFPFGPSIIFSLFLFIVLLNNDFSFFYSMY